MIFNLDGRIIYCRVIGRYGPKLKPDNPMCHGSQCLARLDPIIKKHQGVIATGVARVPIKTLKSKYILENLKLVNILLRPKMEPKLSCFDIERLPSCIIIVGFVLVLYLANLTITMV